MNLTIKNLLIVVLLTLGSATAITAADKSYCKKLAEMLCGKRSKEKEDPTQDIAYHQVKQKPTTQCFTYDKIHVAIAEDINQRPHMEDRHLIYTINPETDDKEQEVICAVFDGHGGSKTVDYVQQNFSQQFAKYKGIEPYTAFQATLQKIDHDLKAPQLQISGTTAVIAHIKNDQATIANVGDSRAILIRDNKVIAETSDHSLKNSKEIEKIEKAGGRIYKAVNGGMYVGSIFNAIAMSRSLGDWDVKKHATGCGVVATPDIYTWPLQKNDLLVLASDGIWDDIPNESVAKLIALTRQKNKQVNVTDLIKRAAETLNDVAQKAGAEDNITTMIIHFDGSAKDDQPLLNIHIDN